MTAWVWRARRPGGGQHGSLVYRAIRAPPGAGASAATLLRGCKGPVDRSPSRMLARRRGGRRRATAG